MSNIDVKMLKPGFWHYPKTYRVILFIEFWERFAFYGLQALVIFYFMQNLHQDLNYANEIFASFVALTYALTAVGGAIGDKLLGLRRTYILGIIFLIAGYILLSFGISDTLVYLSLGLVLIGTVLFKAVSLNYVGRCFENNDPRIDSAYTYFYMVINIGALAGMTLIPWLINNFGFFNASIIEALGIIITILTCLIFHEKLFLSDNQCGKNHQLKLVPTVAVILVGVAVAYLFSLIFNSFNIIKIALYLVALITLVLYILISLKHNKTESKGMFIALVLTFQALLFFVLYIQLNSAIMEFSKYHVRLLFMGFTITQGFINNLNFICVIVLSPFVANWYIKLHHNGKGTNIPLKFAFAIVLAALSFLILAVGGSFGVDALGQVSVIWLVLSHLTYACGELFLVALGPAMITKLLPKRITAFGVGIWFLSAAIGIRIGIEIANWNLHLTVFSSNEVIEHLDENVMLFIKLGGITMVIGILLLMFSKSLSRSMNEISERKY